MKNSCIFYLTFGTVPSLFSEMNIFLNKTPSYIFVRSGGKFDSSCIKDLKHVLFYHKFTGGDTSYIEDQYNIVKEKIIEAKRNNQNVKFIIYIDDSRVQYYLKPFKEANALDDIIEINILSEGNASKFMYYKLNQDDEIECEKRWNNLVEKGTDEDLVRIDNFAYYLSTKDKYKYLLPCFEHFNNQNVSKEYRNKMKLEKFPVEEMYGNLKTEQKKYIYDFSELKIDRKKKYLVIIGTLDFGGLETNTGVLENLIDQMYFDYQDYKLLYKAHPLSRVEDNETLMKYLKEKNIEIIPNKIPLEILLWEYKNIDIGGFSSSIVSLIEPSRVKFVFGQNLGYADILFDEKNPLKAYNLLVSQNLACRILAEHNKMMERIGRLESSNEQLRLMNDELQKLIRTDNKRITRRVRRTLSKIKHKIIKK